MSATTDNALEPVTTTQPAPRSSPALRLGAVALVAAIVGVVVGGGAAYFLVKHFENSSPGSVVIKNVNTPGGGSTASLPALVAQLSRSVVEVISEPATGTALSAADISSGFIAGTGGLIVTSEGAVVGASGVEVALASGQLLPATIASADPDTGVVVLQVSSTSLPRSLSFATSAPVVGDVAIAVSLPLGAGPSVDVGTVSATGLTVTVPDLATASGTAEVDGVLRTDISQPMGSSGGPLVDSAGAVIGILTGDRMQPLGLGASADASGFALDATAANQVVTALASTASVPSSIGLVTEWLDPASAAALGVPTGVLVESVDPGSTAAAAGVDVGDVITGVNGSPAWSTKSTAYPSFSDLLEANDASSTVPLTVVRAGVAHQLSITIPSP
ncbi:MAG: S1C family serine protease [Candidatus Dormiibacterota bacterium]